MKNRTLLSLIEMLIMVMVFSVAAAICLRAFVFADSNSRSGEETARAAMLAQSAAEVMQRCAGDTAEAAEMFGGHSTDEGGWEADISSEWKVTEQPAGYRLVVEVADQKNSAAAASGSRLLGEATVRVLNASGDEIFSIPVCWQEKAGKPE